MRRSEINSGKNLMNQFIGLKGMGIVLLVFFIGMGISRIILLGEDIFLKVILLSVNSVVQVISMILAIIFTYKDERKMIRNGTCVWKFARKTLAAAISSEALFLLCNLAAIFDFIHKIG